MKKISIIIVALLCLATLTIPSFASILPINGASFNAVDGSWSSWNVSASYNNVVNGTDVYTDFALSIPKDKGTDAYPNVAKAVAQHTITPRTSCFWYAFTIEVPLDSIFNEYTTTDYNGTIRIRSGMYVRVFQDETSTQGCDVLYRYSIWDSQGGQVSTSGQKLASYVVTGDDVRGRYYYFDSPVYVDTDTWEDGDTWADWSMTLHVALMPPNGSRYLTFSGGSTAEQSSFIKLTSFYFNSVGDSNTNNVPILNGSFVPYTDDRTLVLDDGQKVSSKYVNPFTGELFDIPNYNVVITSENYPSLAYYLQYVGVENGQNYGFIYTAFVVDNAILNGFINSNRPLQNFQSGYDQGFKDASDNYASYIISLEQQIESLRNGMPSNLTEAWNDGYEASQKGFDKVYSTLDRCANLLGTVTRNVCSFSLFGVNVYSIILLGAVVVALIVILKVASG